MASMPRRQCAATRPGRREDRADRVAGSLPADLNPLLDAADRDVHAEAPPMVAAYHALAKRPNYTMIALDLVAALPRNR